MKLIEAFWKESFFIKPIGIETKHKIAPIFSVCEFSNRCVRYNSFNREKLESLTSSYKNVKNFIDSEKISGNQSIVEFIYTNAEQFKNLILMIFDQPYLEYYRNKLNDIIEEIKNNNGKNYNLEDILFFCLYLYNFFAIPSHYYVDGFIWDKAKQDKANKVFKLFFEVLDKDHDILPKFTYKIFRSEYKTEHLEEENTPRPQTEEGNENDPAKIFLKDETCKIFWNGLYTFFFEPPSNSGEQSENSKNNKKDVDLAALKAKCAFDAEELGPSCGVPFFWSGFSGPQGSISSILEKNDGADILSNLCKQTNFFLFEKNKDLILSLPIHHPNDPIKDFLEKCCIINDWEKAALIKLSGNNFDCKCKYIRMNNSCNDCEKYDCPNQNKFPGDNDPSWEKDLRKGTWINCRKTDSILKAYDLQDFYEKNIKNIKDRNCGEISTFTYHIPFGDGQSGQKQCYIIDLNILLDQKILLNIEDEDRVIYSDCFLIFEYPQYTNFPDSPAEELTLGDYYLRRMIPVIDEIFLKKKSLVANLKASIATIMSRNGSHNIGSHVINRVMEAINISNVQDHRYFYSYLQHRMDFLAQISTDFSRPASPHWFVKEIMKGLYEQRHLLNFIARSENLKGYDGVDDAGEDEKSLKCIIKEVKRYDSDDSDLQKNSQPEKDRLIREKGSSLICSVNTGEENGKIQSPELAKDLMLAIPGGIIGFHALYTIIENFIRNTAKHCFATHPQQDKDMKVRIEVWNYKADSEYYTVRIWDDYSFVSGGTNQSYSKFDKNEDVFEKVSKQYNSICIHNNPSGNEIECNANGSKLQLVKNNISEYINDTNHTKNFVFIVDDSHVFRDNNSGGRIDTEYHEYMSCENVRFIEKAYWDKSFPENTNIINISELKGLLKRFITPSHHAINQNIMESMVDENEQLKKGNWGIGEMRISAGFLAGRTIAEIGGKGPENLDKLIKAIPVPEYQRQFEDNQNGTAAKTIAYRLGYEFRIKKPVDVQIVGYPSASIENNKKKSAEDIGVFFHAKFNAAVNPKMLVLYDENEKTDGSQDNQEDISREFIWKLKKSLGENGEARSEAREEIKKSIEQFGKFTIFVVHNDGCFDSFPETLSTSENNQGEKTSMRKPCEFDDKFKQFVCKRIIFINQDKFEELINGNGPEPDWDSFKTNLYQEWIDHLKVKVRGIPPSEQLLLFFNPEGDKNPANSGFGYQLPLLCIEETMKEIIKDKCSEKCRKSKLKDLTIDLKTLKQKFENKDADKDYLKINEFNWKRKLPELFPQLCKQSDDQDLQKIFEIDQFYWKYLINYRAPEKILKDVYGIFDLNYLPQTLPETIRNQPITNGLENKKNKITFSGIKIIYNTENSVDNKSIPNQIIYKRHIKQDEKPETPLYLENLSGAAPHFPQLCHMPETSAKSQHYYFYGHLIENGLIRIAVADERVCETFLTFRKGLEEACGAGVSFIHHVAGIKLSESADQCDFTIELAKSEGGSDDDLITEHTRKKLKNIDILIIHQGILDKVAVNTKEFISSLKNTVPFVVITSGRGMPENLPDGVKFIPFSVIENSLLSLPHSKFNLIRQIL